MLLEARTLGFASVATLFVVTPGVGTALLMRVVLEDGREAGLRASAGLVSGAVVYATMVASGLSAVFIAVPTAFRTVQLVGGVYVAWLGASTLLRVWRPPVASAAVQSSAVTAYRIGLTTSLLNPMLAVFYLTVIPQFIGNGDQLVERTIFLAGVHIVIAASWMVVLVFGIDRLARALTNPRVVKGLQLLTGGALVALAGRLVFR